MPYCNGKVRSQVEGMDAPLVRIVIVNWNSAEHVLRCLRAVDGQRYPHYQVEVIDNGSADASVERLRRERPEVPVIEAGENLGYGGGNNLGIGRAMAARAEYVWILNPDTEFGEDTLAELVRIMGEHQRLGLLSPRVYHPESSQPEALNSFAPYACLEHPSSVPGVDHLRLIDCAPGCSLLLRRAALEDLGGFDLRYFHFWEDVDLCLRAWRAGWWVGMTERCRVDHRAGSSTRGAEAMSMYYMLRNLLFFTASAHHQPVGRALLHPPATRQVLACLLGVRTFLRPHVKRAIVRALWDAIRHRGGRSSRYSPV